MRVAIKKALYMLGEDLCTKQFLNSSVGNIDGLGIASRWSETVVRHYCLRNVELPNGEPDVDWFKEQGDGALLGRLNKKRRDGSDRKSVV